ncbi:MAG TPA: carbon-nitrogen family hydrolase [Candidatus Cybelea sp.]|jgi:omega-amidase|nr:carbon-nitrogen family hydrolase [Candidatus Cybelea sp.]
MNICACQFDIAWENKSENFERVRALVNKGELARGALVVLPEMFATGFSMNARAIAEKEDGPTDGFLRGLAREKGIYVVGGLVRAATRGRFLNEAVCYGPSGRRVARYDKVHLFSPGGEARHYAPGSHVSLFDWEKCKVALTICYDLRFPELFRIAAQAGANLMLVIANWPGKRQAHWTALLRARAIENQACVIGVNRCGLDPQHAYDGGSIVVNPWGETIAEAGSGESSLTAEINLAAMNKARLDFPVLRDVRTRFVLKKRSTLDRAK